MKVFTNVCPLVVNKKSYGFYTMIKVHYELIQILEALALKPTIKNFRVIARDLSRLVRKEPPWTAKYIHSVYKGYMHPSPLLAQAINSLAQVSDGTPAGIAGTQYTKLLTSPDVPEGVLLPINAKIIKCARPGCPVWFVKVHPRQIYHDPVCRV